MISQQLQQEIKNFYLNEKLGLRQLSRRTGVPKSSIRIFLINENCYRGDPAGENHLAGGRDHGSPDGATWILNDNGIGFRLNPEAVKNQLRHCYDFDSGQIDEKFIDEKFLEIQEHLERTRGSEDC